MKHHELSDEHAQNVGTFQDSHLKEHTQAAASVRSVYYSLLVLKICFIIWSFNYVSLNWVPGPGYLILIAKYAVCFLLTNYL